MEEPATTANSAGANASGLKNFAFQLLFYFASPRGCIVTVLCNKTRVSFKKIISREGQNFITIKLLRPYF